MPSPTTPTHGKLIALYALRPNHFKGDGLNDLAWGSGFNGAATSVFEVVIDGAGTPDTFKWRKNGGAWTETVNITGAAQVLSDGQAVTFGAVTGHTVGDQWTMAHFKDEPCTESGAEAQVTDPQRRLLNPNSPPVFTDSGGKRVLVTDFTRGKALFDGNVAAVDVDGNNGFIPASALQKVGYLIDWSCTFSVDMADASRAGGDWKEGLPGQGGGNGSANAYLIGSRSFLDALKAGAEGSMRYVLLELYTYDPDRDQTGDRLLAWASITSLGAGGPLGEVVKESVSFQVRGIPSFVENS